MAEQRPPAFRGRSSECEVLDRLIDDARCARSCAVVIRGEAGVGKTALLQYVARRATGFRVAHVAGVESEMELAYAGLHQLCSPMLGEMQALPAPQRDALGIAFGISSGKPPDRFLVALAALSLLSVIAEDRPLLCLVDDVQWLDQASSQVLGFVARRLLAERVGIVFAVREPSDDMELQGLSRLSLGGLAEEDSRALLEAVIQGRLDEGVRDRIVEESRGNPLALLELPHGRTATELAGGFALPDAVDLPAHLEEHYRRRVARLPEPTRRLMLLAAADPVGDATLLWRAARSLDLDGASADAAATSHLLHIGARVRFRHPLVRSAVYRAASVAARQAAHGALAAATDAGADPDRRAWHRAHAATAPAEDVAAELVDSASRAESRGGIAAAAAFLERAVAFTVQPTTRAARALTAAERKYVAGDLPAAASLLATAEAGPLDELASAQVERMRAQMAFDLRRGREAPQPLLHAARRLEPLDAELACDTHLEALLAGIFAGRFASGCDVTDVAVAARSAPLGPEPLPARKLLLLGLAIRLTEGYVAAAPTLRRAVRAYRDEGPRLDRMCLVYNIAAMELWDDEAWFELAAHQADLARRTGTLLLLPHTLDNLAAMHLQAGELSEAARLLAEAEGLDLGVRPDFPLRLAAWRGEEPTVLARAEEITRGALLRGEGNAISGVGYAEAVLYNGLAQYGRALAGARKAVEADDVVTSSWGLYELAEAASRCGRRELARDAAHRLTDHAAASGTSWARGVAARSGALAEEGEAAEELHLQAISLLGRTRMAWYQARARLSYGEWLRRENRRVDAREQLHVAHDLLAAMGSNGFAERARRELQATGETVRRRRDDTRDQLTPQEMHIARLAREGRTNPEISAELFVSARTVEWHLRKVFVKLGISSRKDLHQALPRQRSEAASTPSPDGPVSRPGTPTGATGPPRARTSPTTESRRSA